MSARWPARYTVVALSFWAVFICYIDRVNISVAAVAMQDEFGWDETTKGMVLSSFFVGYLALQVASGWLANRIGGRIVLGVAVVWWSIFTMLTPPAAFASLAILIVTRIVLGLGEGATFPTIYTLYRRWIPANERSRVVALMVSAIPAGTLFALLTTGWIVERFGWPMVFYSFGALGLVWAVAWFWFINDDPEHDPRANEAERALLRQHRAAVESTGAVPWGVLFRKAPVWALVYNHFVSNWAFYVLLSWLPSYFKTVQGVSLMSAGFYSAVPWVTMFVTANLAGWFADGLIKRGFNTTRVRKFMQTLGLVGSAAFLLLVRDAGDATTAMWLMSGALGLTACTWAGFTPNHLEIAPRYADVLLGLTNTFGTLPGIIGVAVTGWLVDVTGTYDAAFMLAAGLNISGAIVWLLWATSERVVD
jgi:MFS transporter, ACS family, solute carrier family 17 (sodium-dependent inorganic phosphate cotransporter), other